MYFLALFFLFYYTAFFFFFYSFPRFSFFLPFLSLFPIRKKKLSFAFRALSECMSAVYLLLSFFPLLAPIIHALRTPFAKKYSFSLSFSLRLYELKSRKYKWKKNETLFSVPSFRKKKKEKGGKMQKTFAYLSISVCEMLLIKKGGIFCFTNL